MDILSDELSRAHAEGAVFSVLTCVGPWGFRFTGSRPLTAHILLEGVGWLEQEGSSPIALYARDVLLATPGSPYSVVSELGAGTIPIAQARQEGSALKPGIEMSATVMCGAYVLSGSVGESLLQSLPAFAIIRAAQQDSAHKAAVELLAAEAIKNVQGQQALLDRLLDVNLVYALRAWWQTDDAAPGWYRALDHPQIRRVLGALHGRPEQAWTLSGMAQIAGLSRAAFAQQFTRRVGLPAGQYLTRLRMSRAEDALLRTDATLAAIAATVGYSNEFAFSTAFRRRYGMSPGRWRSAQQHDAWHE